MNRKVLVVGSINIDYVIYTDKQPIDGETVTGRDFSVNCGGKGANQAIAASKQGCCVKMLGAVGSDFGADLAKKNLENYGVDTSHLLCVDGATGSAVITVCGGENRIIIDAGANAHITTDVINGAKDLFSWADIVILQNEIPFESVVLAAKVAHESGCFVIYNPAPIRDDSKNAFAYADVVIPNEHEAGATVGFAIDSKGNAFEALKKLEDMGCQNAVITLGANGAVYSFDGKIGHVPAYKVKAVDTTAAGDSFIGGICASLDLDGRDIESSLRYASAVSALAVSSKGAACSIPNVNEVKAFLESLNI